MELTRRTMLTAAGATAAVAFARTAFAAWEPSQRYPDPAIQTLDPSFNKYRLALAGGEVLRAVRHHADIREGGGRPA